jgi:hypothetical protein
MTSSLMWSTSAFLVTSETAFCITPAVRLWCCTPGQREIKPHLRCTSTGSPIAPLPGVPDTHRILTCSCRAQDPEEVVDEVVADLQHSLRTLIEAWSDTEAHIHVAVLVERRPATA